MRLFCIILSICFCLGAGAQGAVSFHRGEAPEVYDYILYVPTSADTAAASLPLVITLHSRSASGGDLSKVDLFGTIDAIESGMPLNAVVVAPQATGAQWDAERVMKTAMHVAASCPVDTNRVYAIGMSMGGNGVADLAAAYPERIAAAVVLAGSIDKGRTESLCQMPLWVIRGTNDSPGAIQRTVTMVEDILQADGLRLVYTPLKGVDHRQHERLLYMPQVYAWLLQHKLRDPGRPAAAVPTITSKMLKDAYKGLRLRDGSAAKRKSRGGNRPRGPRRGR